MTDHNQDYAYTPMSVLFGSPAECVSGGYMSAHQVEQWGEPLSPERISKCDDPTMGVPASESLRGNAVCKLSPHAGVVYQRYAWGSTSTSPPKVGCEGVVYTWGWPQPQQINAGQDYQAWFRNGELRFSKWIYLSDQLPAPDQMPDPDDHAWWDTQCRQQAWTETTNWFYDGVYRIGSTIYTDTLSTIVATTIPTTGGELAAEISGASYIFPANTFTSAVILTHTFRPAAQAPSTGNLLGVNHFYQLNAVYSDTRQPAQIAPGQSYSVSIQYTDTDLGAAIENSLQLYYWDGVYWSPQGITSTVNITRNVLVAQVDHLSLFAVLGETRQIYLPLLRR
jgi:hypothetical protein